MYVVTCGHICLCVFSLNSWPQHVVPATFHGKDRPGTFRAHSCLYCPIIASGSTNAPELCPLLYECPVHILRGRWAPTDGCSESILSDTLLPPSPVCRKDQFIPGHWKQSGSFPLCDCWDPATRMFSCRSHLSACFPFRVISLAIYLVPGGVHHPEACCTFSHRGALSFQPLTSAGSELIHAFATFLWN